MTTEINSIGHETPPDVNGGAGGSLFPPQVRRVMWGALGAVLLSAVYLISVRGTAIIFDIATAVGSFCF